MSIDRSEGGGHGMEERPAIGGPESPSDAETQSIETALDSLRHGWPGRAGKLACLLALFGVTKVIEGQQFSVAKEMPAGVGKADEQEELASARDAVSPESVVFEPDRIKLVYGPQSPIKQWGGGKENKGGREFEVSPGSREEVRAPLLCEWAGRRWERTSKVREGERGAFMEWDDTQVDIPGRAALEEDIDSVVREILGTYQDMGIEGLDGVISAVRVRVRGYASPEGYKHPEENKWAAEARARLAEEIVRKKLTEQGISADKVSFDIAGEGAEGDVLDFGRALEELGYKFVSKSSGQGWERARRDEVEKLIRLINDDQASIRVANQMVGERAGLKYWLSKHKRMYEQIVSKLPPRNRETTLVLMAYERTIAGHRRVDLQIVVESKPIVAEEATGGTPAERKEREERIYTLRHYFIPGKDELTAGEEAVSIVRRGGRVVRRRKKLPVSPTGGEGEVGALETGGATGVVSTTGHGESPLFIGGIPIASGEMAGKLALARAEEYLRERMGRGLEVIHHYGVIPSRASAASRLSPRGHDKPRGYGIPRGESRRGMEGKRRGGKYTNR